MRFLPRWCVKTSSVSPSPSAIRSSNGEGERRGSDRVGLENGGIFDDSTDIEALGLGRIDKTLRRSKGARTHLTNALATVVVIVAVGGGWYLSRDYLRQVLLWVAVQEAWAVVLVFLGLFTVVSFPFMWGYILVNLSAGYMFGTWRGLAVVVSTATVAVLLVHTLLRCCLREFLQRRVMTSKVLRALLSVLGGNQAFKVIAVTRLTPIPFGLQNAVFAVSRVSTWMYLFATVLGLLPTQILNCYLGTTVRSLDEVVSDSSSATATGWIVFAAQIIISICLTLWVVRRAKAELHNTMALQLSDTVSTTASASLPCTPKRVSNTSSYRRASHADVATITAPGVLENNVYKGGVPGRKNRSSSLFLELLPNNLKHMGLSYGVEEEKSNAHPKRDSTKGNPGGSPTTCSTSSSFVPRSSTSSASRSSSTDDDFILVSAPDHPA
ncbi:transmembrane protein 64 [Penaeus vannamei]|uniref:transmembrane protein 64 n=1 Tax=Penaeus vannamei TaxID=6689 RepID=UPI000F670B90|nr:transmembrane protein 64-like [Penaeus vannamei]XP_027210265.1 transmembrane protein 64-like [Penaeus vannamei]